MSISENANFAICLGLLICITYIFYFLPITYFHKTFESIETSNFIKVMDYAWIYSRHINLLRNIHQNEEDEDMA